MRLCISKKKNKKKEKREKNKIYATPPLGALRAASVTHVTGARSAGAVPYHLSEVNAERISCSMWYYHRRAGLRKARNSGISM